MDANTHHSLKSLYQSEVTRSNYREVRAKYQAALEQFKAKYNGMPSKLPADVMDGVQPLFAQLKVKKTHKNPPRPAEAQVPPPRKKGAA